MSRIAKHPIALPSGVTANLSGKKLAIKGKNGELTRTLNDAV